MAHVIDTFSSSDGVALSLSKDEAYTLSAILVYVGGSYTDSPRKHAKTVHHALVSAGFDWTKGEGAEIEKLIDRDICRPGVFFKDYSELFVPGFYQDKYDDTNIQLFEYEPSKDRWTRVNVTPAD